LLLLLDLSERLTIHSCCCSATAPLQPLLILQACRTRSTRISSSSIFCCIIPCILILLITCCVKLCCSIVLICICILIIPIHLLKLIFLTNFLRALLLQLLLTPRKPLAGPRRSRSCCCCTPTSTASARRSAHLPVVRRSTVTVHPTQREELRVQLGHTSSNTRA
jgi:hypothetical protein